MGLAMAASVAPAAPAPALAPASWSVEKAHSSLGFQGTVSGAAFTGAFRRWDASIRFDPRALAQSSVLATISMGSATTGDPSRDSALPGGDWFAVQSFPRATFEAHGFKALGGNRFQTSGTLTIRNVQRPLSFPFQLDVAGTRAHMRATIAIDRRAFGVGQGQYASTDLVGGNVQVRIDLWATRLP
ncbi:polyisoprenoid-binding protein [Sphingomonas fennica]|uniref:Polyisoprenoid-binding protein n=2 Tax=Edaphosphingomonas fennica TaxID=114404 RepID=A0A2T4HLY6_9SPHN|nr:polyisoprenoid-binding protein [Sphingomonas fennica]